DSRPTLSSAREKGTVTQTGPRAVVSHDSETARAFTWLHGVPAFGAAPGNVAGAEVGVVGVVDAEVACSLPPRPPTTRAITKAAAAPMMIAASTRPGHFAGGLVR